MKDEFKLLHDQAIEIVKNYFKAEGELIEILQKIDQTKTFKQLGYKNLFEYSTQSLKLSENTAYHFISIARKCIDIPLLKEKIQKQEISISNARLIIPILTQENQDKWLYAAQTLSKRELEREVARENPKQLTPERIRYVTADRLEMKIGISDELRRKLSHAQDLISSRLKKHVNLEEMLEFMTEYYIENEDPMRSAARSIKLKRPSTHATSSPLSRYLPIHLRHQLTLRDQAQCTFLDPSGQRCRDRRWIEFHHLKPLSQGGTHDLENLTTLCRGHHQMLHEKLQIAQNTAS